MRAWYPVDKDGAVILVDSILAAERLGLLTHDIHAAPQLFEPLVQDVLSLQTPLLCLYVRLSQLSLYLTHASKPCEGPSLNEVEAIRQLLQARVDELNKALTGRKTPRGATLWPGTAKSVAYLPGSASIRQNIDVPTFTYRAPCTSPSGSALAALAHDVAACASEAQTLSACRPPLGGLVDMLAGRSAARLH